jgi:hypothetical protein
MISKKTLRFILKYFFFTLIFFMLCAFQTSFWTVLIDFLPAPQLWLIFLVFIFLKWPSYSAIFYAYLLGYILTLFSMMPLKMSWLSVLGIFGFVWIFKNRIHSSSLFLFAILCGACSLFYSVLYIAISSYLETNKTSFLFVDRILQAGITFLVSLIVYSALDALDRLFATQETWAADAKDLNSHLGDI